MSISLDRLRQAVVDADGSRIVARSKTVSFSNPDKKQVGMKLNASRVGWIIENDSNGMMYILSEDNRCTANRKTITIPPGKTYEPPPFFRWYTGVITYFGEDTTGTATITEFTKVNR